MARMDEEKGKERGERRGGKRKRRKKRRWYEDEGVEPAAVFFLFGG